MKHIEFKTRVVKFVWSVIPWLVIAAMLFFIFHFYSRIRAESVRLENAKQAANKLVDEGASVKKDQVLCKIDDRDYRSRLDRIEASYDLTKLEYERIAELDRKKITAANRLDEIKAQFKDVTAQKEEAQLALERTSIKAPIEGLVNEITAKNGNFLRVGDDVMKILQTSKVKILVGIPESDVASFFNLEKSTVVIEALGNLKVTGKKVFLSRQPRNSARLFDLELMIQNPDGRILPGMFAKVELVKSVHKNALVIPLYAVITQGDEHFVFIEKNGLAEKRRVQLGILVDWQVQVVSGLNSGEKVIVVGHRFLNENQPIEVIKNTTDAQEILS
ncbi:MAG: efflux RND transporter periplasmic adaptor subunit [Deltaproteobacteria bacterium]